MDEETRPSKVLNQQLIYLVKERNLISEMIEKIDAQLNKLKVEEMIIYRNLHNSNTTPSSNVPQSTDPVLQYQPNSSESLNLEDLDLEVDVNDILNQLNVYDGATN
ncbi:hypothetical protein HDE_00004 [Halotydeus destructor]|nr:hypothetical protein HDE_00004 [Halotydeus destructor]